jgi:hypothetical protein
MNTITRFLKACWNAYAAAFSRIAGALLSNRGLAIMLLLGSVLLIIGPWLRSSVSRDFRGVHIPWNNYGTAQFLPEYVAEAPRDWRWDSIAVPLLAIVAAGVLVVLFRRQWTSQVFGLLLAVSIPALAVALWNHPGLYEFFESEVRGRSMLRVVYNTQSDDLMTVRAPDRLQSFGGQSGRRELLEPSHPLLEPMKYWMYGPWLVMAAAIGVIASRPGPWSSRVAHAGKWAGVGAALAVAATWPRLLAEYHWARAESFEHRHEFALAQQSLERARLTMPDLGYLRRYWQTKGRLDYRQQKPGDYRDFFIASQYLANSDLSRARAELEPSVHADSSAPQRDLLAEIIGHSAVLYSAQGKQGAAEIAWREAGDIASWKPTYWVAEAVTALGAAPERAPEIEQRMLNQLCEVGDCFVGCDFASALGDAYFETGDFERARVMYTKAMDLFNLPKYVNLHAQEGRLGM